MSELDTKALVLQCQSLNKSYPQAGGDIHVLRDLQLQVRTGERVAIVGASGSGKSTLLNVLGGLDEPSSGDVLIAGQRWASMNEKTRAGWRNRHLGFVYQFHHLLVEFSALENAMMPLLIAGMSKRDASGRAQQLLEQVGLEERLHHKPAQLSGGERQRVAIARALVNRPACVLMDEPTGNLDADNAAHIQNLLNTLNREHGLAFVMVTHDQNLARQQDRCLALVQGRLLEL